MAPSDLDMNITSAHLPTAILGCKVIYLPSTPSTMDVAKEVAGRGSPEGTLVLAEEQTGGRGRFKREWVSPPGQNIYMSLVLRPTVDQGRQLGMMASLALAKALRGHAPPGISISIKWPNDVRINSKKIAGILIEGSLPGRDTPGFSVLGMGINVNLDPEEHPEIRDIATSLRRELGHDVSRLEVLKTFLQELETAYLFVKSGGSVREEWAEHLDTLGHHVRVAWASQTFEGFAEGVDEDGSLLLRQADGSTRALPAGEVTLRAQPPMVTP
ncbi:MAG: biotin--[acetyl-CoA-carboxylase] ligase [Chloroflexi bacterium]|nr:biotin--[acetyl-CoA-carboxylase] ligase [Chloroflexota bacterium]